MTSACKLFVVLVSLGLLPAPMEASVVKHRLGEIAEVKLKISVAGLRTQPFSGLDLIDLEALIQGIAKTQTSGGEVLLTDGAAHLLFLNVSNDMGGPEGAAAVLVTLELYRQVPAACQAVPCFPSQIVIWNESAVSVISPVDARHEILASSEYLLTKFFEELRTAQYYHQKGETPCVANQSPMESELGGGEATR